MFTLHRVALRRGDSQIVSGATLQVPSPGLLFVVGCGGAGKSSLLRGLLGDAPDSHLHLSGLAELDGQPVRDPALPKVWVAQHVRLDGHGRCADALARRLQCAPEAVQDWFARRGLQAYAALADQPVAALDPMQRRFLARMADLETDAALYLVDEPSANLDDAMTGHVRARLGDLAARAMVVVSTHNRQDCLALGGHTALLAGGTICEYGESQQFFVNPRTPAGRTYVDTGNCAIARRGRPSRTTDGIWWLVPGLLAGMSRPGLMAALDLQLEQLAGRGVRHMVCLEERCEYPLAPVREAGLQHWHVPVRDMTPPSFTQAMALCQDLEPAIRDNVGVAFHCRGGLGRTGTALALMLIWFGDEADAAIGKVRNAHPLAIQSASQLKFLHEFAGRIRARPTSGTPIKETHHVVG